MSSPIFFAFSPAIDALVLPPAPGLITSAPRNIAPGDDVFYLAAVGSPDGQPLPAAQLETVTVKQERGRIVTVSETVGRGLTRRFGKWELKGVVATRTYSYDKFTKGAKKEAQDTAKWRDESGAPVAIWCKLVRLDTARELGFKLPKLHLGHNRKPGTRTEGREHNAEAPKVLTRELVTVNAVENRDISESQARGEALELDDKVSGAPGLNDHHLETRIRPLDLD